VIEQLANLDVKQLQQALAGGEAAALEVLRLRSVIGRAPHGDGCPMRSQLTEDAQCRCWKREALEGAKSH